MPTHGSLTKAGKVRDQTPAITTTSKPKLGPRRRNKQSYLKLLNDDHRNHQRPRRRRRR
jgi:small subunit ribosomal protein S30e